MTDTFVVLLPGGKANSTLAARPWQLANLRMVWLKISLRVRLPRSIGIRRVRYRVRGWNGAAEDPVRDAGRALDVLTGARRVVLVGHSMGGRVAAHLASRPEVAGVVALAAWWPAGEGDRIDAGTRLVALHGTADTWTSPQESRRQVDRAAARGVDARWIPMAGGHFMVRQAGAWHRRTAQAVAAMLEGSALDG
ncbi:alpha/beta hydrolase [Mycobacterium sp. 236(2023)]|uniref:alpha/beta hydrolase n=1 Tax=Mycobacterium sp. 236(2023) TaxID=3038163 RepID=UPI0024153EBF|nr:alpha/beta hydrolase [Mycobacterium sp. 236(2023)]MDG4665748.1 alpha/beta hydrolase [Mycobacterium sp. 236(2023)]